MLTLNEIAKISIKGVKKYLRYLQIEKKKRETRIHTHTLIGYHLAEL